MRVVENITNNFVTTKRAAMYYKTEPLYVDVNRYVHTNNWEILQAIKVLNSKGFSVDLIDRTCNNWSTKIPYDLFLGLGVGNAGRNFARYAAISGAPKRVLLAMGPQPDVSNKLVLERYDMFHRRTGHYAPPMRTVTEVTGEKFLDIIKMTDFILNIGEKGSPSFNSYKNCGKPVVNFYPSISPKVQFSEQWLDSRDINSFLCFVGNGFICKGVDLLVESFINNPDKKLYICGPRTESAFFKYYENAISTCPNIEYCGFIEPGGTRFNELSSMCSYVLLNSAAEACCTAVCTAMKAGLVPVINSWTAICIDDFGFEIPEDGDKIENISRVVQKASSISKEEYVVRVEKTLEKAKIFSQESFIASYSNAVNIILGEE